MDQKVKMMYEWTGARAPMSNASERSDTCLYFPHFLTPPIRRCSAVGFHRRVSEGAGAPRFHPRAFPMVVGLDRGGDYSCGGDWGLPQEQNPQTNNHAVRSKDPPGKRPGARSAPGEFCDFGPAAKAISLRKMTRRAKRARKILRFRTCRKGDFLKGIAPAREALRNFAVSDLPQRRIP